jgi:hypothetical protein
VLLTLWLFLFFEQEGGAQDLFPHLQAYIATLFEDFRFVSHPYARLSTAQSLR